jgi:multiple sugar transport system substrate-binding protein
MRKKWYSSMLSVALGMSLLQGCGGAAVKEGPAADKGADTQVSNEPVTLLFYTAKNGNYAREEIFDREIGKYIKAKFPNVTIEHIHTAKGQTYQEIVTAGKIPDIMLDNPGAVPGAIGETNLLYDLGELIKKHQFDTQRIDPVVLQHMINAAPDGKLYGLPFSVSNLILFYNKDIFDKFGVPYPKNGVTWDEVYDLAKKITRVQDGKTYRGFIDHAGLVFKYNQLSQDWLQPTQDKALVTTDAWKKLVDNQKRFYDIPYNTYIKVDDFPKGESAMAVHVSEKVVNWADENKDMNWDITSAPVMAEAPATGFQPNAYYLFVSKESKHKDIAFQIIAHLLSDEVQMDLSKQGIVTPLKKQEIQKAFGQDLPNLKGKNISAIFQQKYALPPKPRPANLIYADLTGSLTTAFTDALTNGDDVNTLLRKAEEKMNTDLSKLKADKEAAAKK